MGFQVLAVQKRERLVYIYNFTQFSNCGWEGLIKLPFIYHTKYWGQDLN